MANINTINKIRDKLMQNKKITNDIITNNRVFLYAYLRHNITTQKENIENNIENSVVNKVNNNLENVKKLKDVVTKNHLLNYVNTSKNIENTVNSKHNNLITDSLNKNLSTTSVDNIVSAKNNIISNDLNTNKSNKVLNVLNINKSNKKLDTLSKVRNMSMQNSVNSVKNEDIKKQIKTLSESEKINTNVANQKDYINTIYDNVLNNKNIKTNMRSDIYKSDYIKNNKIINFEEAVTNAKPKIAYGNRINKGTLDTQKVMKSIIPKSDLKINSDNKKSPLVVETANRDLKDKIKFNGKEYIKNNNKTNNNNSQTIEVKMINNNSINSNLDVNQITNYLKDSLKSNLARSISSY